MVHDQSKEGKRANPLQHKTFPNYLVSKQVGEKQTVKDETTQSSSFIADGLLDATPSVPFLRNGKDLFADHHRDTKQEEQAQKDYFAEEKKRFNKEKWVQKKSQTFSLYKSRRPFKPTEVPSLWNSLSYKEEKASTINYQQIKEELTIPNEDLILLDLNPPKDEEIKKAASEGNPTTKTKKALHRSLSGIMEQERIQNNRQSETIRPDKPNYNGFNSFFE